MTTPNDLDAETVIALLGLSRHPEGGWFRETFRDSASTAIYYLLKAGEVSQWHRIDKSEIWHWHGDAALDFSLSRDVKAGERYVLGADLASDQRPQLAVPPGAWQSARSLGAWSLMGCSVAPPFDFALRAGAEGLGARLTPPSFPRKRGRQKKLIHMLAAVDREGRAGDESPLVGDQE
ncbi:MAG TPA: cupin domain-containing protein [Stellaceae bacterium]|jgi:predicted cupin superfamily sugar epimerase|nr:cupin domain-containing protein [Stellaceae bacterium]